MSTTEPIRTRTSEFEPRIRPPVVAAVALAAAAFGAVMWRKQRVTRTSFANASVVITGGSRGFGLALGRLFAKEGARLTLIARDREALDRAAADLQQAGAARVHPVVCDIRDRVAVDAAIAGVLDEFGRIDVLVNNAGVMHVAPFSRTDEQDFRESLDTHFWAPLNFIRACLRPMIAGGGGRIVNIASVGGVVSVPHLSAYCAGKHALVSLSEALRMELAPHGIAVTTVAPFIMRTGSHRNAIVRGNHAREAAWFALGPSTPLTSVDADAAAREVVEATRAGRAHVSPGWQSRAAQVVRHVAPDVTAAIGELVARFVMPGPGRAPHANVARISRDLDLRPLSGIFPTEAARRFNEPVAQDEA